MVNGAEGIELVYAWRVFAVFDVRPIITATYGYTRRNFEPVYDELGAQNLPVEIRAFPSLQKAAAQRLGKMDLVGTVPVLAREPQSHV